MSATLRRHLGGAAAGGLVALAIAGCSSSPSAETTSPGGTASGAVARWQKAVTPVELAASGFLRAVESDATWVLVEAHAGPYVGALRTFDAKLPGLGLTGKANGEVGPLSVANRSVIGDLTAAAPMSPPPSWQEDVATQSAVLDALESDLGLARGPATLLPSVSGWYSGHVTVIRALSVEFRKLGSAVGATSKSPDSANLAALHQACAALLTSATADSALPIPTVSLQRTWETAITLVGTGSAECLNGITDVRTPILKQGIVRMAQGEHDLRQVLDHG